MVLHSFEDPVISGIGARPTRSSTASTTCGPAASGRVPLFAAQGRPKQRKLRESQQPQVGRPRR